MAPANFRQPDLVYAEDIARALNGKRSGRTWLARCPAHADRTPSFSIAQAANRLLVHCHAGCSQETVINALCRRGLWPREATHAAKPAPKRYPTPTTHDDLAARKAIAQRIWTEAAPITTTPAERYFQEERRIGVSHLYLTHAVRWHCGIRAVVGLMTDPVSGEATGVHRTFLDAAGVKSERRMLGSQGVVRLSPDDVVMTGLGISEGIEDGLSILASGWTPVWAATSAGAIARLPVLANIEALTIFADADDTGIKEAKRCAARWLEAGRDVRIATPRRAAHD